MAGGFCLMAIIAIRLGTGDSLGWITAMILLAFYAGGCLVALEAQMALAIKAANIAFENASARVIECTGALAEARATLKGLDALYETKARKAAADYRNTLKNEIEALSNTRAVYEANEASVDAVFSATADYHKSTITAGIDRASTSRFKSSISKGVAGLALLTVLSTSSCDSTL